MFFSASASASASASIVLVAVAIVAPAVAAPAAAPTVGVAVAPETSSHQDWDVNASVVAGTPAVLPGLSLGVTGEVQRRMSALPLFVSARLQWTSASAANESWVIDHQQIIAALGVGVTASVRAGRVWAQAGGGVSGLREVLSRHQLQRIQAANVPGGTERAVNLGPAAFAEVGAAVMMRGGVSGFVAGGSTISRTLVEGGALWRGGIMARVGLAYAF